MVGWGLLQNIKNNFWAIYVGIMHAKFKLPSFTGIWEEEEVTDLGKEGRTTSILATNHNANSNSYRAKCVRDNLGNFEVTALRFSSRHHMKSFQLHLILSSPTLINIFGSGSSCLPFIYKKTPSWGPLQSIIFLEKSSCLIIV